MLAKFIEGKTDFSSYEDFSKNFRLTIPQDFNFTRDVVDYYAVNCPEKRALVWCDDEGNEEVYDFLRLSKESIFLAEGLKERGIKKGDVVMLVLHRRYEYWIFILALNRLGAIALPVPSQMLKNDLEYRISTSEVKMIVAGSSSYASQIEKAVHENKTTLFVSVNFSKEGWCNYSSLIKSDCQDNSQDIKALIENQRFDCGGSDPMIMYFTSGTTGDPKLVVHDCTYPLSHIITAKYWQCVVPDGLHYSVAETGWAKTSWGKIYGQWIAGSAVFVYDRLGFNPNSILEKLQKYKITSFCAHPTIYSYLVEAGLEKYDLSSLAHCCSAGDALHPQVTQRFYEKTGLYIYEGYGQTETALLAANFSFGKQQTPPVENSIGQFSPLYDLQLLNEDGKLCSDEEQGEIVICLENEKTKPAGLLLLQGTDSDNKYYHTGDLAYRAKNGFICFTGRKDNIIKSSGFRISPYEVEKILLLHPSVLECAVVGEDDEKRGKIVKALVVTKDGISSSKELEQELLEFVRVRTALYKCPRKIEFVKSLPKTYNGKIKR